MKLNLKSGKTIKLKDLTIDERDELLDSVEYEGSGDSFKMKMMHTTMTKFIRIAVVGVDDKLLRTLSFSDKSEIFTSIQKECMNLGEE